MGEQGPNPFERRGEKLQGEGFHPVGQDLIVAEHLDHVMDRNHQIEPAFLHEQLAAQILIRGPCRKEVDRPHHEGHSPTPVADRVDGFAGRVLFGVQGGIPRGVQAGSVDEQMGPGLEGPYPWVGWSHPSGFGVEF